MKKNITQNIQYKMAIEQTPIMYEECINLGIHSKFF